MDRDGGLRASSNCGVESGKHSTVPEVSGTFAFADVSIDADGHRLLRDGHEIAIEPKAFAVLLMFLAHPGELLGREQLLDAVWGHSYITPGTLNRLVAQLRRALHDDSDNPRYIQTVHGLGYRFIAPMENSAVAVQPAPRSLRFAPPMQARLPRRAGPLVGRERDIEALRLLLGNERLVTVLGSGGIGKTQAALETARQIEADFPDGAWLFDCTLQTDIKGLLRWLANTFDIRAEVNAENLLAEVAELLQARRALLVFDNCERVAEPLGRILATLTATCDSLRVLATSQQRLSCVGESLYWLPPLAVPPSGAWDTHEDIDSLAQVPAVQLLLMRSRAFASGFALTRDNAHAVAEICQRLDGLPLALEIAAARLRLLNPAQLLKRLNQHLLTLAEPSPGRPPHHQTLHALIEWSFALLSEHEQALLRGLSVFAGTCTVDGASAIGAVFGFDDEQTLDLLGGLVDKSLLTVDASPDPPSYRLLDSVRLFAQERLVDSKDEARVREAHLRHFVEFSAHAYVGERQPLWFERIRLEWANLRVAFEYAMSRKELVASALELTGNLCWYYRSHTDYIETVALLERALREAPESSPARAKVLVASGLLLHHARKSEQAVARLREGSDLAQAEGDGWLAGAGQAILAFELAIQGDFPAAEAAVTEALEVADALDDDWLRSNALLSRGIGHSFKGRHDEAIRCIAEALERVASHGDYFQREYTRINLALQRFYVGDLRGAARDWLRNLDAFGLAQNPRGVAGIVEGTAYLAAERGEFAQAARFLAAAARMRQITGGPLVPQWRQAQEVAEKKTLAATGVEFERLQQAGATARFEDVVAEARGLLVEVADQSIRAGASRPSGS
jgi:non-specific serine/threonine protein kinase